MKKLLAVAAAAALVGGAAFAADVGFWNRSVWMPVQGVGSDVSTSINEWAWDTAYYGGYESMNISASTESYGCNLKLEYYGAGGFSPSGSVWIKPIDQVKLQIGNFDADAGRLSFGYGMNGWYRLGAGSDGDDLVFTKTGANAAVTVTPVNGLWMQASTSANSLTAAKDAYKAGRYAAGYTMDGMGSVQVQYVGGNTVNAAVTLNAVDNLWAAAGVFIPVETPETTKIAACASYQLNNIGLKAYTTVGLVKDDSPVVHAGAGADVALDNGYGIVVDGRFGTDAGFSGLLGATKNVGGATLGLGFEGYYVPKTDTTDAVFAWALPVKVEFGL